MSESLQYIAIDIEGAKLLITIDSEGTLIESWQGGRWMSLDDSGCNGSYKVSHGGKVWSDSPTPELYEWNGDRGQ